MNNALRVRIWSTFQWVVYSFWATTVWKLFQKRIRHALFDRPKSSFGEHKVPECLNGLPNSSFGEHIIMAVNLHRCPCSPRNPRIPIYRTCLNHHNPSNGCFRKVTVPWRTCLLEMFGWHSSVLDGLWLKPRFLPVWASYNREFRGLCPCDDWYKCHLTHPKSSFGKDEQKMKCVFSTHFSSEWVLNFESLKSLNNPSKNRISSFVSLSTIFVWGA